MMNEETIRKLTEMRMSAMAESYREQLTNAGYRDKPFEDRFNLLVDHEYARRKSNTLQRLIKQANSVSRKQQSKILSTIQTVIWIKTSFLNSLLGTIFRSTSTSF